MEFQNIAKDVKLGKNVTLSSFINLYGCEIGDNTKIGAFVEIQKGAIIGSNCKISSHSFICEGVTIESDVFIGHNVTFINDRYPRAVNPDGSMKTDENWICIPTLIKKGASIGSSVTLFCGVTIGANSMIGAGTFVMEDVPDNVIYAGNPGKIIKKIDWK